MYLGSCQADPSVGTQTNDAIRIGEMKGTNDEAGRARGFGRVICQNTGEEENWGEEEYSNGFLSKKERNH